MHKNAFGLDEGEVISKLIQNILIDKTAMPLLSLICLDGNEIIGHILFSTVKVEGHNELSAYILAPLAVLKNYQGKGVGSSLIEHGLKNLKSKGVNLVFVLGDTNYYKRNGFNTSHNIKPPYSLEYPEAWMVQELNGNVLNNCKGVVQCSVSLNSPEFW